MDKLCSTCRHLCSLASQNIYWCMKDYNMNVDNCDRYEPLPETTTISSNSEQAIINLYWEK